MKKHYLAQATAALAALTLTAAAPTIAGTINHWDMHNVTVAPPPHTMYELHDSTVFTDSSKTLSYGAVYWKESDNQAPGMQVVNDDFRTGENCIMATGFLTETGENKTCSDPFQESKRWKVKAYENEPVDIYFSVTDDRTSQTYRSMQKLTNATSGRLQGFTMELGFMANGVFLPSTPGDGLGFSERRGRFFEGTVTYDPSKPDVLSAFFPHDIAGAPDENHPDPGYFYPEERMYIDLEATEDKITSTGISQNHLDILGEWYTAGAVPVALFYDDDNNPYTDNELMAHCEWDYNPDTLECQGEWVTYRSCTGLDASGEPCDSDGIRKVVPQATIDQFLADPLWGIDYFDDVANVTLNYFITVARKMTWPTPDQFVLRITTIPSDGQSNPPPSDDPPVVDEDADVAVTALNIPRLKRNESGDITVTLNNTLAGAVDGQLNLTVRDDSGATLASYSSAFTTPADSSSLTRSFRWTAPSYRTTVTVTATAQVEGDIDPGNNTLSATQRIN
ncbi:choice-of-anchor F family protein [Desulfurivibrio sp. D14AmB]|uniref:choice-of-anchor F family protein n=1 Tax=Desulfurivibrio sp. D14AmB TaxID=3374370 RepID=UPI00376EAD37